MPKTTRQSLAQRRVNLTEGKRITTLLTDAKSVVKHRRDHRGELSDDFLEGFEEGVAEMTSVLIDNQDYGASDVLELISDAPMNEAKRRLEYLRGELRAQRISTGELIELESLIPFIDPGDTELLEAAGVPEFPSDKEE